MRLYYGTYGHRLSGKLYAYWGDDNLRTGQQVVAPVTNKKTGKDYNTMFTIARAQNEKNAQGEVGRLENEGIFIKTIVGRDTLSLPGGTMFDSKAGWKRDSDRRYENTKRQRLGLPPLPSITQKEQTKTRKLMSLPGGSAPVVRPNSQLIKRTNRETVSTARNRLLSSKKITADTTKQKERLRAMRSKKN